MKSQSPKIITLIKKYPLAFIVLGTLLFFTIILVITALNLHDTTEVDIRVTPASSEIIINGKNYQNGTYRIPTGELAVEIHKDGFETYRATVKNNSDQTKIYVILAQSDGSTSWYDSHNDDAILMSQIGDYYAEKTANKYLSDHPITEKLPIIYANYDENYDYTEFRIDGGDFDECQNDFCLKITDVTGGNYDLAKEKIKDSGYNPDDYEIIYEYTPIQPL